MEYRQPKNQNHISEYQDPMSGLHMSRRLELLCYTNNYLYPAQAQILVESMLEHNQMHQSGNRSQTRELTLIPKRPKRAERGKCRLFYSWDKVKTNNQDCSSHATWEWCDFWNLFCKGDSPVIYRKKNLTQIFLARGTHPLTEQIVKNTDPHMACEGRPHTRCCRRSELRNSEPPAYI